MEEFTRNILPIRGYTSSFVDYFTEKKNRKMFVILNKFINMEEFARNILQNRGYTSPFVGYFTRKFIKRS